MGKLLKKPKFLPRQQTSLSAAKASIIFLLATVVLSAMVFYTQHRELTEVVQAQEVVPTYGIFERALTANSPGSIPYSNGPEVTATFTGTSGAANGKSYEVHGFWDGDAIWRIRFAPTAAGNWNYTTNSSDSGLGGKTGSLLAEDQGSLGFIIRDPNDKYAFKRSNGGNIFLMGDTCWNCMSTSGVTPEAETDQQLWEQYVDIRVGQDFNFMRSYILSLFRPSKCPNYPWCATNKNEGGWAFRSSDGGVTMNPNDLRAKYFQWVDTRIEYANSQGMTMFLTVGSDARALTNFFENDIKLKRYLKYLASRFSAYDIAWDGRLEFEEQNESNPTEYIALGNLIGTTLRQYDPYNHLQSMHTLDSSNELGNETWYDWVMHQGFEGHSNEYTWNVIVDDRNAYNKPVMNIEFFYEVYEPGAATHQHHAEPDVLRKGAWQVMMNGSTGLAFGNTGTLDSAATYFMGLEYAETPGAIYMSHLYNFFKDKQPWRFTPAPTSASTELLSDPGNAYIAYFETGFFEGYRPINVQNGDYRFDWYNPRTGEEQTGGTFSGNSNDFVAPTGEDWVLYIQNQTVSLCDGLSCGDSCGSGKVCDYLNECIDKQPDDAVCGCDNVCQSGYCDACPGAPLSCTWQCYSPDQINITNLTPINYQTGYLQQGDAYYVDRTYTLATIPPSYQDLLWIKTANYDKLSGTNSFLNFNTDHAVTVYVAYDQRLNPVASWLANWKNENQSILTSSDDTLNLYSKSFCSGQIILGGNFGIDQSSMYSVLIKKNQADSYPSVDSNCDQAIDTNDLTNLKSLWGQTGKTDLNQNNITDVSDLGIMMSKWGNY